MRKLAWLSIFLFASCGGGADFSGGGGGGGGFGATPGGVKDMQFARELVAAGQVPPPEALLVEGMFSEHDLALDGPPCQRILCLRAGLGIAPTVDGEASGWFQVGLSSTVDPETWVRPSTTFIATVDVSGSMGWGYADDPTPGEISRRLLHAIAGQLRPDDRIAIVTYGSIVSVPLQPAAGGDPVIAAVIDGLGTEGSTNMEAGLRTAYDMARYAETPDVRVLLFTDVQPNVGATSATEFQTIVGNGAAEGVGITVFGLGLGLGQELLAAMSHLRGGNAFSLNEFEDVGKLMEEEWPWFVTPIANDLTLTLTPSAGFAVTETYGFPGGQAGTIELELASVFLSRKKGALLARLVPSAGWSGFKVDARLAYTTPEGEPVDDPLAALYVDQPLDERGRYFDQPSIEKAVALALLVDGMHRAAQQYAYDHDAGADLMRATNDRFKLDAAALGDPALDPEVTLSADLLELMEAHAPQGNLYP
jgi:Ca-activated chloride channel homolog